MFLGRRDTAYTALDRRGTCESLSAFVRCDTSCTAAANWQPGIRRRSRANRSCADWTVLGEVRIFQCRSIERLDPSKVRSIKVALNIWRYASIWTSSALGIGTRLCRTSLRKFAPISVCNHEWVRFFSLALRYFPGIRWVFSDCWISGMVYPSRVGDWSTGRFQGIYLTEVYYRSNMSNIMCNMVKLIIPMRQIK